MDADAPSVMSGSMSWSDVLVKKTPSACGRDAHDNHRRQRVIALANENVALNLTTTTTELSTAAATVTVSATVTFNWRKSIFIIFILAFLHCELHHLCCPLCSTLLIIVHYHVLLESLILSKLVQMKILLN